MRQFLVDLIRAWRTDRARTELDAVATAFQSWADLDVMETVGGPYFQQCADYVLQRLEKL